MVEARSLVDAVLDFHYDLFDALFTRRFAEALTDRRKRDRAAERVRAAALAAAESLIRYFERRRMSLPAVEEMLAGLQPLAAHLDFDQLANPNLTAEVQADEVAKACSCPQGIKDQDLASDYRLALYSVVRALKRVAPVFAAWERLGYPRSFDQLDRTIAEFDEITDRIVTLAPGADSSDDERFEIDYREYILQRFYQVEAGTVRMTAGTFIDLRQLFVLPDVRAVPSPSANSDAAPGSDAFLSLAEARKRSREGDKPEDQNRVPALKAFAEQPRLVIIGAPGAGKSTFLEWLNLQLASAEFAFAQGDQQAIPVLLRVRQLDPHTLPEGAKLIAAATEGEDRARQMPTGWLDRQMRAGRVVFMLDGLDETEPELRDGRLLPWFAGLCRRYPKCRYLVSSRPVGYPPRSLRGLKFTEHEVCDFSKEQVGSYASNWCTAIRLARNETKTEAEKKGAEEGQLIVTGFVKYRYIADLARNPLMLSAVCLVNYFEGGQLPGDRAVLYKLCVEGLLHNWDQRRGILSAYPLAEKLRVCREVAIAMQAADRAEAPAKEIRDILARALGDENRAEQLLEHIRYRTGVLIERRPQVFSFAHLTFQEYLAASALVEENLAEMTPNDVVIQHSDGRWNEVIPLYCGIAPAPQGRAMLERLVEHKGSEQLGSVLAEAFLTASPALRQDSVLRAAVVDRIARSGPGYSLALDRFDEEEVRPVANRRLGQGDASGVSGAHWWLLHYPKALDEAIQLDKLVKCQWSPGWGLGELVFTLHRQGSERIFHFFQLHNELYAEAAPEHYLTQAAVALDGMSERRRLEGFVLPCLRGGATNTLT